MIHGKDGITRTELIKRGAKRILQHPSDVLLISCAL
jgi:hypothetical protein